MLEADRVRTFIAKDDDDHIWLSVHEGDDITAQPGLTVDEAIELATDILITALAIKQRQNKSPSDIEREQELAVKARNMFATLAAKAGN
jgi:hypothetical protein